MPDNTPLSGSTLHALCVYAEPLVAGRRVVVFGDATRGLGERLLDLGARVVHLYDPNAARAVAVSDRAPRGLTVRALPPGDFDVRDGAFDVAVLVDVADFSAPAPLLARVRRLLAPGGAVLVRSCTVEGEARGRLRQGSLDYYELYDLVAMQFAHVRMIGEIPWTGVALAELGRAGAEPDVTVDTQLIVEADAPEAFVALGSEDDVRLAEYALVQIPTEDAADTLTDGDGRADLAAAQLRASLLEAQVEELRAQRNYEGAARTEALASADAELADRLSELQVAEARARDAEARAEEALGLLRARDEDLSRLRDRGAVGLRELDEERRHRSRAELELAATRSKLEAMTHDARALAAAAGRAPAFEAAVAELEGAAAKLAQRLHVAEQSRASAEARLAEVLQEVDELREIESRQVESRGEMLEDEGRAEAASARVAELEADVAALEAEAAVLSDGHGAELATLEEALRDRARAVYAVEQELLRRERIILDLVHALEEARTAASEAGVADSDVAVVAQEPADDRRTRLALADAEGALREARQRAERARAEAVELREKLDAAAVDAAKREAANTTNAWRIQELEQAVSRLEDEQSELTMTIPPPAFVRAEREATDTDLLTQRLAAVEDEVELLRQALAQEHDARVRAESGEELTRARADLARQAALLETLSRELEAHDGVRRPREAAGESGAGRA